MRMRRGAQGSIVAVSLALCAAAAPAGAQNRYSFVDAARSPLDFSKATVKPQMACPDVRTLAAGTASILAVEIVAAAAGVPEHCRVTGSIAPEIRFEVNLPAAWNRRFYMSGNGGFAGEAPDSPPRAMVRAAALRQGFVTATTNTGHDATKEPLARFAVDPQKIPAYAFRAGHLTALAAKGIATRYYDRPVAFSYWDGCSTGGRQGLILAQRFPGDFDGIVAGAPVLNFVDTTVAGLWNARAVAAGQLTLDTMKLVADVLYAKCGPDGVIDDPRRCPFDPTRDLPKCAGAPRRLRDRVAGAGPQADLRGREPRRSRLLPGPAARCRDRGRLAGRRVAALERLGPLADRARRRQIAPARLRRVVHAVHGLRQAGRELRREHVRLREGPGSDGRHPPRPQRDRSGSLGVPQSRGQALDVLRLGRRGADPVHGDRLLRPGGGQQRARDARLLQAVHGAGDVPLPGRRGHGPVRRDDHLDQLGRGRHRAREHPRGARGRRAGQAHAAVVPVSSRRPLQGLGQRRRGGQLRVRRALSRLRRALRRLSRG